MVLFLIGESDLGGISFRRHYSQRKLILKTVAPQEFWVKAEISYSHSLFEENLCLFLYLELAAR